MPRRFAIGDIHGCLKTFIRLVEDGIRLTSDDILYPVGDFIDRGPDSKGVLDYVTKLMKKGFRIKPVRGNHEEMLLESITDPGYIGSWIYNGAEPTMRSFGLYPGMPITSDTVHQIPKKYIRQIEKLPYYIKLDDYLIVHAGFNFYMDNPFADNHTMIWSRQMQYDPVRADNRTVIHGHTPISVEEIREMTHNPAPGLINIDGGCVYTSYSDLKNLVAIDLDSRELFVQKNIDITE
jgi:serine/threonine protein phosphatase 1